MKHTECALERSHFRGGRTRRRLRHGPPDPIPLRDVQEWFVVRGRRLAAERRRLGHGVSYGEAFEEMEELSVDTIGYGMSVVAKDTVAWCCLRWTSRRADCGMPVNVCPAVYWCKLGYAASSPRRRRPLWCCRFSLRPADYGMPVSCALPETLV